ncbi:type VII secretion protein EsaA [Bacillus aerolatus]|uniref:Type VII secretion protein EsaA n=1 Tax=Bacillus aerolatus TaxID=2653354 RepID=A0A6I1FPB9_9BACI|nr:type VII secretion protein EsaA [Bacillus aerolatus]KAB7708256.1 type VII secretion protein EsaA [Bacillus aerolatus]
MEKKNNKWKLTGMMAAIVLLPVLFFTFIGENPMKKISRHSGQIAIVNEDIGAAYNKNKIEFGRELTAGLSESSDYKWTVVNRSAAEKGLEKKQYDAILYIPTDFSNNILTFKDETPIKADVNYTIQSYLDGKNRQKVQKEMERVKNKINKQVSTLYWGVVSQELTDVREKFDAILEKEIAFQKSMYKFYTPSSKDLSEEIEQQQKMLQQLRESAKSAEGASKERTAEEEKAADELAQFVADVNTYKEYQIKQNELLKQAGEANSQLLQDGIASYEEVISQGIQSVVIKDEEEAPPLFSMNPKGFIDHVSAIRSKMDDGRTAISEIITLLDESTVAEQYKQIQQSQIALMKHYKQLSVAESLTAMEEALTGMRRELENGSAGSPPSGDDSTGEDVPEEIPLPEEPESPEVDMDVLSAQAALLKEKLTAMKTEENASAWEEATKALAELEEEMNKAGQRQKDQAAVFEEWSKAAAAFTEEQNKETADDPGDGSAGGTVEEKAVSLIRKEEESVLASELLSEERKKTLSAAFGKTINSYDITNLFNYYGYLKAYRETLEQSAVHYEPVIERLLANEGELENVEEALIVIRNESGELEKINTELSASSDQMNELESEFTAFAETVQKDLETYEANVAAEQKLIAEKIQAIDDEAAKVTAALQEKQTAPPEAEVLPPVDSSDGSIVLSIQANTLSQLQQISALVGSLSERHGQVADYTDDLQKKVDAVQAKANELNTNWDKNVQATGLVRNDVYDILGNTFADGPNNRYVYDYLANPVNISGKTPPELTEEVPPVIMLVVIVISGMLLGYFLHHYQHLPISVHLPLTIVLNLAVGTVISLYGLSLYPLTNEQAIMWTVFTILLLFTVSAIIRFAYWIGPFPGMITGIIAFLFFITPLIELSLPNFHLYHPVSEGYISIQYSDGSHFYPVAAVLALVVLAFMSTPYLTGRRESGEVVHEN